MSREIHTRVRGPLTFALIASAALAACSQTNNSNRQALAVQTAKISESSFKQSVNTVSVLESTTNVALRPETDGRVIKKLVEEGDTVQAGQIIIVLDNTQQSAALNASKAEARTNFINAERYQYLYEQGATSAKQRDYYATLAIQSRDQAITDKATLNYKFVRSPIDGIVGDLDTVKIGDYIKTGEAITGIVNNSTLWTLMQIPATQANRIKIGQDVNVASQGKPPIVGQGKITFISPYFGLPGTDEGANTVKVKATFPNLTNQLKTGQFVNSEIITSRTQGLGVPVQAVFMEAEKSFVYVVKPLNQILTKIKASTTIQEADKKKLEELPGDTTIVIQRPVQLGPLDNNTYPVESGLREGEYVAVSNTARLKSGMPVKATTVNSSGGIN